MTDHTDRVMVAVLTFRRPRQLADILPALVEQADSVANPVEILVVDNDPEGGASAAVLEAGDPRIRYVHEVTPGIAAARNRAIDEGAEFDVLAFIDDDERPSTHWLATLLATRDAYSAAAVTGPVLSRYEVEPGEWIRAGRFFERKRHPTGTRVEMAPTSNLLLDLDSVRTLGVRFDERFGLSGGSDSLFTRQLTHRGGSIVWCDDAVVLDLVPAGRLTREWVLQRSFRFGNAASRLRLEGISPWRQLPMRLALLIVGSYRFLVGFARFLVGALTGHLGNNARGLRTAARGAGMVTGSFGSVYREYRRH